MKAVLLLTLLGLAAANHVPGHIENRITLFGRSYIPSTLTTLGHMAPVETGEEPVVEVTRKYWRLVPVSSLAAPRSISDTVEPVWPGVTGNQEVVPITAISEEDLIREKPVIKFIHVA